MWIEFGQHRRHIVFGSVGSSVDDGSVGVLVSRAHIDVGTVRRVVCGEHGVDDRSSIELVRGVVVAARQFVRRDDEVIFVEFVVVHRGVCDVDSDVCIVECVFVEVYEHVRLDNLGGVGSRNRSDGIHSIGRSDGVVIGGIFDYLLV